MAGWRDKMENGKKGSLQDAKCTMEIGGMAAQKKEGKQGLAFEWMGG